MAPSSRGIGAARCAKRARGGPWRLAASVLAGALVAAWPLPAGASCQSNTLTPGTFDMSMAFGGTTRNFRVHVPPSYTGKRAVPLVLDLHGLGETLGVQQYVSGFAQSADPFGTNLMQLQQVFAIDTLGRHLRQVTQFRDVYPAPECGGLPTFACFIDNQSGAQDLRGRTVVFGSSCDPFDTGAVGEQLFAIDPHTFRLAQLTAAHGCVVEPDGSLTGELPGPFAYSELRR